MGAPETGTVTGFENWEDETLEIEDCGETDSILPCVDMVGSLSGETARKDALGWLEYHAGPVCWLTQYGPGATGSDGQGTWTGD